MIKRYSINSLGKLQPPAYFLNRCTATLITAGILLDRGMRNQNLGDKSIKGLWSLGFGAVTAHSLTVIHISGSGGLLLTVLIANLPQVILSFLYLTYNGLFTCMLLGQEWSQYAHHRKPLRVTYPVGRQRSTYRLQLPYAYGVPLMVFSGALHWLVSQSIFLARVTVFNTAGEELPDSISTCGYSCIAIIAVIIVGFAALVFGNVNGFRKYPKGMPLVSSCSAAISTACHPLTNDTDASVLPLMWGVVKTDGSVGHCCFTSFEILPSKEAEEGANVGGSACLQQDFSSWLTRIDLKLRPEIGT